MINTYKNTIRKNELKIDKQQTKIRNWRRWSLGGFGVTIGFILAIGAIGTLGQVLKSDSETKTEEN